MTADGEKHVSNDVCRRVCVQLLEVEAGDRTAIDVVDPTSSDPWTQHVVRVGLLTASFSDSTLTRFRRAWRGYRSLVPLDIAQAMWRTLPWSSLGIPLVAYPTDDADTEAKQEQGIQSWRAFFRG